MLKKMALMLCLVACVPVAAGAQTVAPTSVQSQEASPGNINLSPPLSPVPQTVVAENQAMDVTPPVQESQPKKFHSGLTFKEWCEIHFGENRWIYWAGAAAGLIVFHVLVAH